MSLGLTVRVPAIEAHSQVEFWISTTGNNNGTGDKQHPFATFERARDAVRASKSKNGATVWIEPGLYARSQTLTFNSEDSGTDTAPIRYRAEGGTVRFHAGHFLRPADFEPVTDPAIQNRLDSVARNMVIQFPLSHSDIKHVGPFPNVFNDNGGIIGLFCNDLRMPISRWPNEGPTTMSRVLDRGDTSRGPKTRGGKFVAREDRVARWHPDNGVWLEGYWRVPWDPEIVRVKAIDPASHEITLAEGIAGGVGSKYAKNGELGDGKEPWSAVNVLEEIDKPGEWCIDFSSKTLFFWPPQELSKAEIYVSDFEKPLVELKGASNVILQGMIFEGGLGNGVEVTGGSNNLVVGCTCRNLGGTGVVIKSGTKNGVRSSDFYALGYAGIYLGGGDRKSLTPCGNFADNNHIHDIGIIKKCYAAGINVGAFGSGEAVGCVISHNLIHDLPHAGVLYGGNDNVLEFNEVARVVLTSGDMGAFYATHDWTSRGNVVRHNFVYDSPRANAFYMDDGDSGVEISGNVVVGFSYGPFIGGGHDNIIRNNIVVSTEHGLHMDDRGVARGYDKDKGLRDRLNSIDYKQPPWSTRYPTLPKILDANPAFPRGNVIERNVTVDCKQPLHMSGKKENLQFSTVRDNLELSEKEIGFVDASKMNYNLMPDSIVFTKLPQFEKIPFEKMGLYADEFRTTIPTRTMGLRPGGLGVFDSETDVQRSNHKNK